MRREIPPRGGHGSRGRFQSSNVLVRWELRACTHTETGDIGAPRAGQCRFCSHQDVLLPRLFGLFMTIEHLKSMRLPVPAVPTSFSFANNDFVPNTIIGPACAPRIQAGRAILELGSRPRDKRSARWGGSTSASYRRGGLAAARA